MRNFATLTKEERINFFQSFDDVFTDIDGKFVWPNINKNKQHFCDCFKFNFFFLFTPSSKIYIILLGYT